MQNLNNVNKMMSTKNAKIVLQFFLFSVLLGSVIINTCFMPSLINSKTDKFQFLMKIFGFGESINKVPIMNYIQCDSVCPNNCIGHSNSEGAFVKCLNTCNCEFANNIGSNYTLYFAFFSFSVVALAVYLNIDSIRSLVKKAVNEYKYEKCKSDYILLNN